MLSKTSYDLGKVKSMTILKSLSNEISENEHKCYILSLTEKKFPLKKTNVKMNEWDDCELL